MKGIQHMSALHMHLMAAPGMAREAPAAHGLPPAFSQLLEEVVQVIKGSVVRVAPAADLDLALRRDLGLD
jgi:hypothetical protein